ncbi:phosphoglycerate kinase [Acidobacteria bacterium Mor1]|nr:phosphoglycerate kinase [Acidobacteria bacterium Mor1]
MKKLDVRQMEVRGKRVFCRVDFNVPLDGARVADDTRIQAALPTIRLLSEQGAKVILASHLGRPKGQVKPEMSLKPAAECLAGHLGRPVAFAGDCVGDEANSAAHAVEAGGVLLLENLRFHAEETGNDESFAAALAGLGEAYVNDAFGTAHRAHASTAGVPSRLRPAGAGLLMQSELEHLGALVSAPEKPFVAVLGGAKVSDKIELIDNLMPKVDAFVIGGAMAYTFLKSRGIAVGGSLVEGDKLDLARELSEKAEAQGKEILLPVDHVVAVGGNDDDHRPTRGIEIADDEAGMDIGPKTAEAWAQRLGSSKTVLWNGPVGRFEVEAFSGGSRRLADALAAAGNTSVVGGGDTAAAVRKFGLTGQMTHVSTGGGASLEFLSGTTLPGVAALDDA